LCPSHFGLKENGSPLPKFDTNEPERTFFIVEIPIHQDFKITANAKISSQVSAQVIELLNFCKTPKSREEILSFIGISNQTKNYNTHILPLLQSNWIEFTIKDNTKDRNQKYVISELGESVIRGIE